MQVVPEYWNYLSELSNSGQTHAYCMNDALVYEPDTSAVHASRPAENNKLLL